MAHGAFRLLEKYANKPQLIEVGKMEVITSYLKSRCEDDFKPSTPTESEQSPGYSHNEMLGIGMLSIEGPLTYKPVTFMGMECGGANYQAIKEDFDTLIDSGVHTVILNLDSGGGEAYQCFDTARYIRQRADENNVRIISFVDGLAASAAYGLACVADEIVATSDSEVGSIGVLVKLMNDSKALSQAGYERTFVTAGKSKVPFDSEGNFTSSFLSDLQSKVDDTYSEFVSHVSNMRSMSDEAVINTEAKTFTSEKAMELGLLDKVMTHEEFYKYLQDTKPESQGAPMLDKLFKPKKLNEETLDMDKIAELEASLLATKSDLEGKATELAKLASVQAAFESEKADLVAKLQDANEQLTKMQGEVASKKAESRKNTLLQYFAKDKAEALNVSLADLSDEAFDGVTEGFKAQHELVKKSELMTELGGNGEQELETQVKSVLDATRLKINQNK